MYVQAADHSRRKFYFITFATNAAMYHLTIFSSVKVNLDRIPYLNPAYPFSNNRVIFGHCRRRHVICSPICQIAVAGVKWKALTVPIKGDQPNFFKLPTAALLRLILKAN